MLGTALSQKPNMTKARGYPKKLCPPLNEMSVNKMADTVHQGFQHTTTKDSVKILKHQELWLKLSEMWDYKQQQKSQNSLSTLLFQLFCGGEAAMHAYTPTKAPDYQDRSTIHHKSQVQRPISG